MDDTITRIEALSQRQKEILRLMAQHHRVKEVARILDISVHTVKAHTDEARRRLGVGNIRDAARLLAQYEGTIAIPEDRGPLTTVIGKDDKSGSSFVHGQQTQTKIDGTGFSPERAVFASELGRAGPRVAHAGSTGQDPIHRGHVGDHPTFEHYQRTGEGVVHDGVSNRLVDGRSIGFIAKLRALNSFGWLGMIFVIAIGSAVAFGGLLFLILGMLEAMEHIFRRTA